MIFNQNKATASPDDSSHVESTTGKLKITRSDASNLSAMNLQFIQIRQTLRKYQMIIKIGISTIINLEYTYRTSSIQSVGEQCTGKLRARSVYLGDNGFDGGTERIRNVK